MVDQNETIKQLIVEAIGQDAVISSEGLTELSLVTILIGAFQIERKEKIKAIEKMNELYERYDSLSREYGDLHRKSVMGEHFFRCEHSNLRVYFGLDKVTCMERKGDVDYACEEISSEQYFLQQRG